MADQCIVCLEDLDVVPDPSVHHALRDAGAVAAPTEDLPTPHPSTTATPQPIALIKPCNHVLHDECLREWSQKANSCPICRHAFNLVEVLDKVGGLRVNRAGHFCSLWPKNCTPQSGVIPRTQVTPRRGAAA
ncbi:hypothetical protein F5882DRAFT_126199 [Hyaloscypha sp. PMI_1271]|nr:hypothetical protein F5882DRAFT_126199 [Hyaloscypha sp. PMI_1271]